MVREGGLYAAYLRGLSDLLLHEGNEAAAEFQKLLDHRGLVGYLSYGALARLGLARAYAFQGDAVKARAAYNDFLTLWKTDMAPLDSKNLALLLHLKTAKNRSIWGT
jgi:hypothetical protein